MVSEAQDECKWRASSVSWKVFGVPGWFEWPGEGPILQAEKGKEDKQGKPEAQNGTVCFGLFENKSIHNMVT